MEMEDMWVIPIAPDMWVYTMAFSVLSCLVTARILFYFMRIYMVMIKDPDILRESIGFYEGNFEQLAKTELRALRLENENAPAAPVTRGQTVTQETRPRKATGVNDVEEKTDLNSRKDLELRSGKGSAKMKKLPSANSHSVSNIAVEETSWKNPKRAQPKKLDRSLETKETKVRTVEAAKELKESANKSGMNAVPAKTGIKSIVKSAIKSALKAATPAKDAKSTEINNSKGAPVKNPTPNSKEKAANTTGSAENEKAPVKTPTPKSKEKAVKTTGSAEKEKAVKSAMNAVPAKSGMKAAPPAKDAKSTQLNISKGAPVKTPSTKQKTTGSVETEKTPANTPSPNSKEKALAKTPSPDSKEKHAKTIGSSEKDKAHVKNPSPDSKEKAVKTTGSAEKEATKAATRGGGSADRATSAYV